MKRFIIGVSTRAGEAASDLGMVLLAFALVWLLAFAAGELALKWTGK